ncbi:hypothetical protein C6503_13940, partial [Candidatus Poribacteria bacterium]
LDTVDAATYGSIHAPATYRQAGCQAEYNSIDHKTDICRFSWYITHHTFIPYKVRRQTHCQATMLCMSASVMVLIIPQFGWNVKYILGVGSNAIERNFIPNLKDWAFISESPVNQK